MSLTRPLFRPLFRPLMRPLFPGESWTPLSLFSNGEQGAWYDPSDLTTLYQDAAGTIPVTADGDPVGLMLDKSGNGADLSQSTASLRPLYPGLRLDGTDDYLGASWASRTSAMDAITAVKIDSGAPDFLIFVGFKANSESYLVVGQSGSTSSLISSNVDGTSTGTLYIDGVEQVAPTRGAVYTALADGQKHIIEIRGANFSDDTRWGNLRLGNYRNQLVIKGSFGPTILRETLTESERQSVYAYLEGVTL